MRKNVLSVYISSNKIMFLAYKNKNLIPLILKNKNNSLVKIFKEGLEYYKNLSFVPEELLLASSTFNNIILEKKGKKTALICTKGFRDLIYIGRRPINDLYNLKPKNKKHVISKEDIFEIDERILASGEIEKKLSSKEAKNLIDTIIEKNYDSVAVSLMHSLKNNKHEEQISKILEKENINYTLSSYVSSDYNEYERTSTTILSSYIVSDFKNLIDTIKSLIPQNCKINIMGARGGLSSSNKYLYRNAIQVLYSAQAASLLGAKHIGKELNIDKIISFDLNNNETNISIFDEDINVSNKSKINNLPISNSSLFIRTIGTGLKSNVSLGFDNSVNIGLFTNDNNLPNFNDILIYLGYKKVEQEKKEISNNKILKYFENKISKHEIKYYIEGIFNISAIQMARSIKKIASKKDYNLYDFSLFAFGEAAGIYASVIANELKISQIIIPRFSGIFPNYGMLQANIIRDRRYTLLKTINISRFSYEEINVMFNKLKNGVKKDILKEKVLASKIKIYPLIDIRYKDELNIITIPFSKDFVDEFHKQHDKLYGYSSKNSLLEIINLRVRGIGYTDKLNEEINNATIFKNEEKINSNLIFNGEYHNTPIYDKKNIITNEYIKGPAIIDDYGARILVFPNFEARLDEFSNIIISRRG